MKAADIKKCCFCDKGVGHVGIPIFYRVTVQSMVLDGRAIQQVAGAEMMMGNVALARVLGPDPDIARGVGEPSTALVCHTCAMEPQLLPRVLEAD